MSVVTSRHNARYLYAAEIRWRKPANNYGVELICVRLLNDRVHSIKLQILEERLAPWHFPKIHKTADYYGSQVIFY